MKKMRQFSPATRSPSIANPLALHLCITPTYCLWRRSFSTVIQTKTIHSLCISNCATIPRLHTPLCTVAPAPARPSCTAAQARRWKHPPGAAQRFLSHILTYPLSLAAGLKEAAALKEAAPDQTRLSVVCIGARAEGSLPPSLWLETLIALPGVGHLDLHLLGPEVAVPLRLPTALGSAPGKGLGSGGGSTARMNLNLSGDKSLDVTWTRATLEAAARDSEDAGSSTAEERRAGAAQEAMEKAVQAADVFVLFNPGLGHPHLRQGWESAAERLLVSGLPMVVTCHSPKDLARDHAEINAIGQRCLGVGWAEGRGAQISPRENAFRSLRQTEDPLGEPGDTELVSPNWGMLVVGADRKRK